MARGSCPSVNGGVPGLGKPKYFDKKGTECFSNGPHFCYSLKLTFTQLRYQRSHDQGLALGLVFSSHLHNWNLPLRPCSSTGYEPGFDAPVTVVIVQLYRAQGFVDLVVGGAVTIHLSIYEKTICSERTHPRAYSITSGYELR